MTVKFNFAALKKTKLWELGIRFLFGGTITVVAGLLAKEFGPVFGGLFLAFPAIFPASATLIERHEREKKRRAGIRNSRRGRKAAALDAKGAALGSLGLALFAWIVYKMLPGVNAVLVLAFALAAWFGVGVLLWRVEKKGLSI
jgi:hypothetical protein